MSDPVSTTMNRRTGLIPAAAVLLVALCVGAAFVRLDVKQQMAERREATVRIATKQAAAAEREIDSVFRNLRTFTTEIDGDRSDGNRVSAAAAMAPRVPLVQHIFLAAGGAIETVYPARADGTLGETVLTLTQSGSASPAAASMLEAPALLGPLRFKGADYVVAAVPTTYPAASGSRDIGGWAGASIPLDRLLHAAEFDRLADAGYDYQLSYVDRRTGAFRTFSRSSGTELTRPVEKTIAQTDSAWRLSMAPREGWLSWSAMLPQGALAAILAFAAALMTHELGRRSERFRRDSEQTGQRLQHANRRLTEEIKQREDLEKQFNHAGFHDAFTGLPNRRYCIERLERGLRRARQQPNYFVGVIAVSFDRLKSINDSLGHAAGDQVLLQAAQRFVSCLRGEDVVVGRLGGDEIAVLLFDIRDPESATAIATSLLGTLSEPFEVGGRNVYAPASLGLALGMSGYDRAEELIRNADTALSTARADGQTRFAVFDSTARDEVVGSLQLETDLHRAVREEEFRLVYQPIISFESGQIAGMEALLRWQHPLEGMLAPDRFIRLAEETGLIVPITRWVLRAVCEQARSWRGALPDDIRFYVSMNLSAQDMRQSDLGDYVASLMASNALPPGLLRFEVTEGSLISNMGVASDLVAQLRGLGSPLLLDDFGTGYSSLSYLQRFQFDYLKIDRSFVNRITAQGDNAGIVRAIVHMATDLEMKTIAEGVETVEVLQQLRKLGCQFGQGYYFSRPVEPAAMEAMLQARRRWPLEHQVMQASAATT